MKPQVAPAVHIQAVRAGIQTLAVAVVVSKDLMAVVDQVTAAVKAVTTIARMDSADLVAALVEQRFAVVGNRFLVAREGSRSPEVPKDPLVADQVRGKNVGCPQVSQIVQLLILEAHSFAVDLPLVPYLEVEHMDLRADPAWVFAAVSPGPLVEP
jgi:hypothetical protein